MQKELQAAKYVSGSKYAIKVLVVLHDMFCIDFKDVEVGNPLEREETSGL